MDRFQNRIDKIRTRNKYRYINDQEIMKTYHIKTDLTRKPPMKLKRLCGTLKIRWTSPQKRSKRLSKAVEKSDK